MKKINILYFSIYLLAFCLSPNLLFSQKEIAQKKISTLSNFVYNKFTFVEIDDEEGTILRKLNESEAITINTTLDKDMYFVIIASGDSTTTNISITVTDENGLRLPPISLKELKENYPDEIDETQNVPSMSANDKVLFIEPKTTGYFKIEVKAENGSGWIGVVLAYEMYPFP
jgi:hypothetical protein